MADPSANSMEEQIKVLEHRLNFLGKAFPASTVLLGTVFGALFIYLGKSEETSSSQSIRFAEIAISILAGEQSEDTDAGRLFAIRLLERSTGVDMKEAGINVEEWVKKGRISPDKDILGSRPAIAFDPSDSRSCAEIGDGVWRCVESDALVRAVREEIVEGIDSGTRTAQ